MGKSRAYKLSHLNRFPLKVITFMYSAKRQFFENRNFVAYRLMYLGIIKTQCEENTNVLDVLLYSITPRGTGGVGGISLTQCPVSANPSEDPHRDGI